jgi:hypothetical protein
MEDKTLTLINKIIKYLLIITGVSYFLLFLIISIIRLHYPYELEWIEGSMVDNTARIMDGKPFWVEPSIEFTPHIYTPFYYYVAAFVAKFTGIGFFPLRLVSFISTILSALIIFQFVKKETWKKSAGLISASLFFAGYGATGFFYDLGRVDMLFLLLVLCSFYIIRLYKSVGSIILAGIISWLALMTKQSGLPIFFVLIIGLFFYERKKAILYSLTLCIIIFSVFIINYYTDNWFSFYVFKLPGHYKLLAVKVFSYWINDISRIYFIGFAISLIMIFLNFKTHKESILYLSFLVGMLAYSWFSRIYWGGWQNVLIPGYTMLAITFGIGIVKTFQHLISLDPKIKEYIKTFGYILILAQFFALFYNPFEGIPTKENAKQRRAEIQRIKEFKGNVYIPCQGYLARMTGNKPVAHVIAMYDVITGDSQYGNKLLEEMKVAVETQKYSAIFINDHWKIPELEKYYEFSGFAFQDNSIYNKSGFNNRNVMVFTPKKTALINN